MSDEIDTISAKRYAYDANVIAHGGVFVVLNHDGVPRLERGFVRLEDEALADPQPENEGEGEAIDQEVVEDAQDEGVDKDEPEIEEADQATAQPINGSPTLHQTAPPPLALPLALGGPPDLWTLPPPNPP